MSFASLFAAIQMNNNTPCAPHRPLTRQNRVRHIPAAWPSVARILFPPGPAPPASPETTRTLFEMMETSEQYEPQEDLPPYSRFQVTHAPPSYLEVYLADINRQLDGFNI